MKILCKNSCVFENKHFSFFIDVQQTVQSLPRKQQTDVVAKSHRSRRVHEFVVSAERKDFLHVVLFAGGDVGSP